MWYVVVAFIWIVVAFAGYWYFEVDFYQKNPHLAEDRELNPDGRDKTVLWLYIVWPVVLFFVLGEYLLLTTERWLDRLLDFVHWLETSYRKNIRSKLRKRK